MAPAFKKRCCAAGGGAVSRDALPRKLDHGPLTGEASRDLEEAYEMEVRRMGGNEHRHAVTLLLAIEDAAARTVARARADLGVATVIAQAEPR